MEKMDNIIEILNAIKEGKQIEVKYIGTKENLKVGWFNPSPGDGNGNVIFDGICGGLFNSNDYEYRIAKEPKIRPYKNITEFLRDERTHGPRIQITNGDKTFLVIPLTVNDCGVIWDDDRDTHTDWDKLSQCRWADGHRCGIYIN